MKKPITQGPRGPTRNAALMTWTEELSDIVLIVYIITLIIGLPANLLSFYTFVQKVKQGAKPIDIILLSLNLSDLIFLFFLCIRIKEAAEMNWNMDPFLCPFSMYIFMINIYNSTLLLASISVERYLGVAFAIWYKLKRHPRNAVITSVIIWVFNMAHCSIVFYIQQGEEDRDSVDKPSPQHQNKFGLDPESNKTCYWNFNNSQLIILLPERLAVSIVAIFIPLAICCFCYIKIIIILLRLPNVRPKKRLRAIGLAMATLLLFMICFMPYGLSNVVGFIKLRNPSWRVYALLCSSCNTLLDPFIYYFSSKSLDETLKRCKQCLLTYLQPFTTRIKESGDTSSSHQVQQGSTSQGSSEE